MLYPSADEFERIGARMEPILNAKRPLRRQPHHAAAGDLHGAIAGETFWCHVSGRALNREAPHEAGIWTFEDLGSRRGRSRPN